MADSDIERATSPESAPRLRPESVKASTVGEAVSKASELGAPAGQAQLDWVIQNPTKAAKMLTRLMRGGNYYFFPAASDGVRTPYVFWRLGQFWIWYRHNNRRWHRSYSVVLVD